jgi:hypothetical protein
MYTVPYLVVVKHSTDSAEKMRIDKFTGPFPLKRIKSIGKRMFKGWLNNKCISVFI